VGEFDALHFRRSCVRQRDHCGFGNEMRAWAETVRIATVRADTTRLHPVGQEGGLIISGATFRAADHPLRAAGRHWVLIWELTPFVSTSTRSTSQGALPIGQKAF